jgi:peptidoglycan hydrolase-like protein with peptidoglycan-binding domain
MPPSPISVPASGRVAAAAAMLAIAILGSACSGSSGDLALNERAVTRAEEAVAEANAELEQAGAAFCDEARDYIAAIDRYGKAFNDSAATVGDLETLGADLAEPRDTTVAAAQVVLDAHEAVNVANQQLLEARTALEIAEASVSGTPGATPSPIPTPAPSAPSVPSATVERVRAAESELEAASGGVTDETPIRQAAESFNAAALALEAAWLNLFADAGCLTDQQSKDAAAALREYTVALQEQLKKAGYLEGEADGVYGPETVAAVEALQTDAGLPVTGLVDRATRAALDDALAASGESAAAEEQIEATAVQTMLKLTGYWPGPIDGAWTPELEDALREFQVALGVEPTGALNAETMAALQEALIALSAPTPSPTASATPTVSPTVSPSVSPTGG